MPGKGRNKDGWRQLSVLDLVRKIEEKEGGQKQKGEEKDGSALMLDEPEAEKDGMETRKMVGHTPVKKLEFWGSTAGMFGKEGQNPEEGTIPATGQKVTTTFGKQNVFHVLPRKNNLEGISGKNSGQREETPADANARDASE